MGAYESQRKPSRRRNRWAVLPAGCREVDQLAVDSEGRLVLAEIKDTPASSSSVRYTPFQLLHYVWECPTALESVRSQLKGLRWV